ncbi:MAG: hypothetical protein IJZ40_05895 [Bacteroidaceae bacterium]|nr:hypothetical protein [Bacteroidaceae bacterium]
MKKEKEVLILSQKLTELKLKQKMLRWTFYNTKNMSEKTVNAILDEKNRTDRAIAAIEARLKELEN